jgi:hypothetical protein
VRLPTYSSVADTDEFPMNFVPELLRYWTQAGDPVLKIRGLSANFREFLPSTK